MIAWSSRMRSDSLVGVAVVANSGKNFSFFSCCGLVARVNATRVKMPIYEQSGNISTWWLATSVQLHTCSTQCVHSYGFYAPSLKSKRKAQKSKNQQPRKKLPQIGHLQKRDPLSWTSLAPFRDLLLPSEEDFVHALRASRSSVLLLGANAAFTTTKKAFRVVAFSVMVHSVLHIWSQGIVQSHLFV